MREKPPQRVVCVSSHRVGAFYFSQNYTEEQNTQSHTETLSQPISQNLTAKISYNVLWILYAGGVLWARNVGGKVLLNLWVLWEIICPSVRDKTPHASCMQPNRGNLTYYAPPCGEGDGGGAGWLLFYLTPSNTQIDHHTDCWKSCNGRWITLVRAAEGILLGRL